MITRGRRPSSRHPFQLRSPAERMIVQDECEGWESLYHDLHAQKIANRDNRAMHDVLEAACLMLQSLIDVQRLQLRIADGSHEAAQEALARYGALT